MSTTFRNIVAGIDGVIIFPIISLIFFTIFFVVILIHAFRLKKDQISELENLPFNNTNNENEN